MRSRAARHWPGHPTHPDRTKELNFFRPEKEPTLVICDMPGYGYAKASKKEVAAWNDADP